MTVFLSFGGVWYQDGHCGLVRQLPRFLVEHNVDEKGHDGCDCVDESYGKYAKLGALFGAAEHDAAALESRYVHVAVEHPRCRECSPEYAPAPQQYRHARRHLSSVLCVPVWEEHGQEPVQPQNQGKQVPCGHHSVVEEANGLAYRQRPDLSHEHCCSKASQVDDDRQEKVIDADLQCKVERPCVQGFEANYQDDCEPVEGKARNGHNENECALHVVNVAWDPKQMWWDVAAKCRAIAFRFTSKVAARTVALHEFH